MKATAGLPWRLFPGTYGMEAPIFPMSDAGDSHDAVYLIEETRSAG